jgi:CRISPR-associated endonuclease/helicase Cas3
VYVVDRRAVVDQATDVARMLREYVDCTAELKTGLGLANSLPISTLRGQHVDNKEWLEDPASPAIIVGTVDMIGSRLLFEGYGTTRKMRPYHAGLLGADTLVVLDEAHLVPPFEKLLESIANGGESFGPRDEALQKLVPPFRVLSLSATGRTTGHEVFGLTEADLVAGTVARKRLDAIKRLIILQLDEKKELKDEFARHAWELADRGARAVRCIVFSNGRKDAAEAMAAIEKLSKGNKKLGIAGQKIDTELFVGGRRVFEREMAAIRLKNLGFLAGTKVIPKRPAFVFATSAGEVGVDLDADHMVSDLVTWERMVQRLGRVNRRGDGQADVVVVQEPPRPKKAQKLALGKDPSARTERETKVVDAYNASAARVEELAKPLDLLPPIDGAVAAGPGAILELKQKAEGDPQVRAPLDAATTPEPLRPALSRALVDAWSMTSLKEHTGRPEIQPWLRGWGEDPPQTCVVWRTFLPVRATGREATKTEIEAFFEAASPHASERLETETSWVIKCLEARAKALVAAASRPEPTRQNVGSYGERPPLHKTEIAAVVLGPSGNARKTLKLRDLLLDDEDNRVKRRRRDELQRILSGATVVVDARIGGLRDGLLDSKAANLPRTVDDGKPWNPGDPEGDCEEFSASNAPVVAFRVRTADAGQPPAADDHWRERHRFAAELSLDGESTRWLVVDKWRHDAATEDDRSAGCHPQLLADHQAWVEERAKMLGNRLGLPAQYVEMLEIASRLHDGGKQARVWQTAFNAGSDGIYAKTRGPVKTALLGGYRHEFGSLSAAESDEALNGLPDDLQDLALHLIAAHHGFARPVISTGGCEAAPPFVLDERAREVALRFARLQKRWGPWGLAWWEALLRSADQQASRAHEAARLNDKRGDD